jgi:hypothetical protein
MKNLWLLALLFFLLNTPLFAQTQDTLDTSGNAFLRVCSVADKDDFTHLQASQLQDLVSCVHYTLGIMDGVQGEVLFVQSKTKQIVPKPFCLPPSIENGQMVRVVLKFIREHPTVADKHTATLAMVALGDAYPCPSK